ncbi:MAG: hypothetical protein PQJ50_17190 [Spirochaetales bacterium]|nr:hypothetical protein [Spirochaetales bacterium]
MKNNNPKRAKGRRYPIEISCVAWIDLLGYGSMLEKGNFDPSSDKTFDAVSRLRDFHSILHKEVKQLFPIFIMNDGACIYRDLNPRTSSVTNEYIKNCINLFNKVNENEKNANYPGARMVIASGPRIRSDSNEPIVNTHIDSILSRYENSEIPAKQAIYEAFSARSRYGVISELQANFAFTRAYLAETGGSEKGFAGRNCFIDERILKNTNILGIDLNSAIYFNERNLNTNFHKINEFNICNLADNDFNNGYEICELLGLDFKYDKYLKVER